jgi:transposase
MAAEGHGRRKFYVLADVAKAPISIEAMRRIDALFAIERDINGLPPEARLAVRQERIAPLVEALETWMRAERARLSRHNDTSRAMDYMLV